MTCDCTKFYKVTSGDGCWQIANDNGISLDNFYAWNPTNEDCKNLFPGDNACVAKGTTTTTKPTLTTPTVFVPFDVLLRTQEGSVRLSHGTACYNSYSGQEPCSWTNSTRN
jgi:hypothetical protein